jgi:hypothetical protein
MGHESKKVSLVEVWIRLAIIVTPLVGPHLLDLSKGAKVVIPGLWLIFMGPLFLIPLKNLDDWEDNAKPYYPVFQSIGKLYLGLILLSACARRPNSDHPCRLNLDQGWKPSPRGSACG